MELADLVVFNKADIDPLAAQRAAAQMRSALGMLHPASAHWQPPVLTLSALRNSGIDEFWSVIKKFQTTMVARAAAPALLGWMWSPQVGYRDGLFLLLGLSMAGVFALTLAQRHRLNVN